MDSPELERSDPPSKAALRPGVFGQGQHEQSYAIRRAAQKLRRDQAAGYWKAPGASELLG